MAETSKRAWTAIFVNAGIGVVVSGSAAAQAAMGNTSALRGDTSMISPSAAAEPTAASTALPAHIADKPLVMSPRRRFPSTKNKLLVFTDQLPNQMTPAQWRFAATHYVGTQKETRNWAIHMRRLNPGFIILHYQLALGAGKAAFVTGNQWTNDFARVKKHPKWFLRTSGGKRIKQTAWGWDVMNILFRHGKAESGFPAYWVAAAKRRMRENMDDGVFADSYTQDILMNQTVPRFSWFHNVAKCEKFWLPQLNTFGAYCAAALRKSRVRRYYLPNLGGLVNSWDHTTNMAVGDGGMNEGFCVPGGGKYYALGDWKLQMGRLLRLARLRKILLLQTYLTPRDADTRWFVIGSYLLVKGSHTYINMFTKNSLEWYPQYLAGLPNRGRRPSDLIGLGTYLRRPRAKLSDYWVAKWHVYRRRFAGGMVVVNPSGHAVTLPPIGMQQMPAVKGGGAVGPKGKLPRTYKYRSSRKVTVPAHSARVLIAITFGA